MSLQSLYKYIGSRKQICEYRFNQILDARQRHFYQRRSAGAISQQSKNNAKKQVMEKIDTYFNCLRNQYEQQIPSQFSPMIHRFKKMAYQQLKPAYLLEDQTNQILRAFYKGAQ